MNEHGLFDRYMKYVVKVKHDIRCFVNSAKAGAAKFLEDWKKKESEKETGKETEIKKGKSLYNLEQVGKCQGLGRDCPANWGELVQQYSSCQLLATCHGHH